MTLFILGIVVVVQSFIACGIYGEVNNFVKSAITFTNQDLVEKNTEVVIKGHKQIRSRSEIYELLAEQIHEQDKRKFQEDFAFVTPKELRHLDILIYLMSQYKFAAKFLLDAVFEIILEHEREFESLMSNFV